MEVYYESHLGVFTQYFWSIKAKLLESVFFFW